MSEKSKIQPEKRALILYTSHPQKEASRKYLGNSAHQCQSIYRAFLKHILSVATDAQQVINFDVIVVSDQPDRQNIDRIYQSLPKGSDYTFVEHRGKSFGEKFDHALKAVFNKGYNQLAVIGNDCLDITPDIIQSTFQRLTAHDVVLGPSKDGGFYLVGIRESHASLFDDVGWCTGGVFEQVCQNVERQGKSLSLLPGLSDIDTNDDLRQWLLAPHHHGNHWLYLLITHLLTIQIFPLLYLIPFINKFHLNKRIWQKPPPRFDFPTM
ncbi:glycosyltransferase [Candidatus Saccharibacteria bacterium]|nr:glycosyltransferase [Candidatus Saccharibacteria bacterium]NIV71397.1 DUF2064 domain-containing protein [Calditrichia bacterium]NIW78213.1 DUF2064 domain-containing protein [Calditrichia bacterium]